MLGKTVVNIEVKRVKDQPLPAITVCIPAILSMTKLSNLSEFNRRIYQDYIELITEAKNNGTFTDELKQTLRNIYLNITDNHLGKIVKFDELMELSPTHNSIIIDLKFKTKSFINKSFIKYNSDNTYALKEAPLESFIFSPFLKIYHYGLKCFTYFSALKEYWHSFGADEILIQIMINNDYAEYPQFDSFGLWATEIAIHSNNILQTYGVDYINVKSSIIYSLKYFQISTQLLLDGFESNCAEYDIRNKINSNRMQSDCLAQCYAQFIKDKYKSLPRSDLMIGKQQISFFGNISINFTETTDIEPYIENVCSQRCKPDCSAKQFLFEISKSDENLIKDAIIISLIHGSIPDVIVRHIFEMSLISFVCNFGGLLGMWLGLSLLSISKQILETIRRFSRINAINFNLFQKFHTRNSIKIINIINNSNAKSDQNNLAIVENQ